jgi:hypothetical protein
VFPTNGQHTDTHFAEAPTVTVVVLVSVVPVPTCVPGSPLPVSPGVSCHGAGPISNVPLDGVATSEIDPGSTLTVSVGTVIGEPPLTVSVHHMSKFFTVNGVVAVAGASTIGLDDDEHAITKVDNDEHEIKIKAILGFMGYVRFCSSGATRWSARASDCNPNRGSCSTEVAPRHDYWAENARYRTRSSGSGPSSL